MGNKSWPFKHLDIGQSCTIESADVRKARAYVYVYGNQMGKKFSCAVQADGRMVVTRLPLSQSELVLSLDEFHTLASNFSKERLREIAQMMAGPFKVERRADCVAVTRREG
jgi:hypothetical protein